MAKSNRFSGSVIVFQGDFCPEAGATLAGYSALIERWALLVPAPDRFCAISQKNAVPHEKGRWRIFGKRYQPEESLAGHLTFALKYEGVDLAILKALFSKLSKKDLIKLIAEEPTSGYRRRIWFLYEWLMQDRLDLPDATSGNAVDLVDPKLQYPGPSRSSKRHRVRNNLPGTVNFCPLIRRTKKLDAFIALNLSEKTRALLKGVNPDVLSRACAFLLLKDSKASYTIEGETPTETRAERWGRMIGAAGKQDLSKAELTRLQGIVLEGSRFIPMGYRTEGGFIGAHDRTGMPVPDHICARVSDLESLMNGLFAAQQLLTESDYDSVFAAAAIAFGFVFIHPFYDGNGRIHRYLIQHVLGQKGFTPVGLVFPVSAAILDRIAEYRDTLESYSLPRLGLIEWNPTPKGNVEVTNETIDLYRYFDATRQAEFLYECIFETIKTTLPEEIRYLNFYDHMHGFITKYFRMPHFLADLLIRFLIQGNGKLSKRAREKEFAALTDDEVARIEVEFKNLKY